MQVWELHTNLSNAIGDPIRYTSSDAISGRVIPDGVRYSKQLRDNYIFRAGLEIQKQITEVIASLPHKIASSVIEGLHPTNKITNSYNINGGAGHDVIVDTNYGSTQVFTIDWSVLNSPESISRPMFLLSAMYIKTIDNRPYPLPIKTGIETQGLLNSRNVQQPDDFIEVTYLMQSKTFLNSINGDFASPVIRCFMFGMNNFRTGIGNILLRYVPYAGNPAYMLPTDSYHFELTQLPKLLSLATLYALQDSQEDGIAAAMAQATLQNLQIGVNNASN